MENNACKNMEAVLIYTHDMEINVKNAEKGE